MVWGLSWSFTNQIKVKSAFAIFEVFVRISLKVQYSIYNRLKLIVDLDLTAFHFVFRWKLNGTAITPKSVSHYSLSGGNLRISHLDKDQDAGTYQCLASNSFGTIVSREASLTFACKWLTIFYSLSDHTVLASSVKACDRKDISVELVIVSRVLPDKAINMEASPWGAAFTSAVTPHSGS